MKTPFHILASMTPDGKVGASTIAFGLSNAKNSPDVKDFIVRAVNSHEELVEAIRALTKEIQLNKLNIRKDFSLINAHACALKAVFKAEGK